MENVKHGYHSICEVSLGFFGWISLFTQGMAGSLLVDWSTLATDGTARKLQQVTTGVLNLSAVKGIDVYSFIYSVDR